MGGGALCRLVRRFAMVPSLSMCCMVFDRAWFSAKCHLYAVAIGLVACFGVCGLEVWKCCL